MTEFYHDSNCGRCIRSSPLASLWGLILVMLGAGGFAGGALFLRRSLREVQLQVDTLVPYFTALVYGVIVVLIMFSFVAYLVNAISSGWNGKHFFDSSKRIACGRCLTMTFLVFHLLGLLLWIAFSCLCAYILLSLLFLLMKTRYAHESPYDLSYYGLYAPSNTQERITISSAEYNAVHKDLLICSAATLGGCLAIILGHVQMALCLAMNYARMEETRFFTRTRDEDYYDAETRTL